MRPLTSAFVRLAVVFPWSTDTPGTHELDHFESGLVTTDRMNYVEDWTHSSGMRAALEAFGHHVVLLCDLFISCFKLRKSVLWKLQSLETHVELWL
jgi:hypothetical protein